MAHTLGDRKAVILRNHGLLTVGPTVDAGIWSFITMERWCHAQLLAMAAGDRVLIDPEQAAITTEQVGSDKMGWLSYQPLYERMVREQPDVLE